MDTVTDRWETKRGIGKSRKEGKSCVNDGVNDFANDILKGVTFTAFQWSELLPLQ